MTAEPVKGVLVDGEWVRCQETIEVVNPYTSAVVGEVGQAPRIRSLPPPARSVPTDHR